MRWPGRNSALAVRADCSIWGRGDGVAEGAEVETVCGEELEDACEWVHKLQWWSTGAAAYSLHAHIHCECLREQECSL